MMTSPTLLIDGNNLLVRAVKAMERVPLSVDGVPTGALLVFINMLSRHVREERPGAVVVCWDGGKSVFRRDIYPGYKADRGEQPTDEPDRPFAQAKEFLTLAGVHHVERDGFEADDLIANYWRQIRPTDSPIVIVSGDKDLLQLVDRHCVQVRPTTAQQPTDRWDVARVEADLGCRPAHLAQVMALTGDKTDGVPGVKGFGPKTACKVLAQNGWNAVRFAEALGTETWEQVKVALRLVDLRNGVPYVPLAQPPPFAPTLPGDLAYQDLLEYLDRYRLETVKHRLLTGELWPVPNDEGN